FSRSSAARWINRNSYAEAFDTANSIHQELREFGASFPSILGLIRTPSGWTHPVDPTALPDLWSAAGWIPFYIDREEAGTEAFRSGYAYAEVMGPWGMLRVDEIAGEPFQGEIGMTVQRAGTFYPPHFHHAPETYMPLEISDCVTPNTFLLTPAEFGAPGEPMTSPPVYRPMTATTSPLIYIARRYRHGFRTKECALVTVWARTVVRDGRIQETSLCRSPDPLIPYLDSERAALQCH
ncbi:MAG: dimethylsulfonioproprionate lyase family protein, partial [Myxococcota bacterium]